MRTIGLVALSAFLAWGNGTAHEGSHGPLIGGAEGLPGTEEAVFRELEGIAESVRSMLPMAVNEDTQAVGVEVSGRDLIYRYRFLVAGTDFDRDAFGQLKRTSISTMCTTPDVRSLLERGAKITYLFLDRQDIYVTSYTICRLSCREGQ